MRNLALSAASTWYLGVGAGLICLCACDCQHVGVGFTLQGQWEVDEVGVARVVVNDCKI